MITRKILSLGLLTSGLEKIFPTEGIMDTDFKPLIEDIRLEHDHGGDIYLEVRRQGSDNWEKIGWVGNYNMAYDWYYKDG